MENKYPNLSDTLFTSYNNNDSKSEENLKQLLSMHHFVQKISVIHPVADDSPSSDLFSHLSTDKEFYIVRNLSLHHLIEHTFKEVFSPAGSIFGMSHCNGSEPQTTSVLYPDGRLSFLVSRQVYLTLGLEGRPSMKDITNQPLRYIIHINSLHSSMKQGSKCHSKHISSLRKVRQDFKIRFTPTDPLVCPSSVAKYFSDLGYEVDVSTTKTETFSLQGVSVPSFDNVKATEAQCVLDSIGSLLLRIDPASLPHITPPLTECQRVCVFSAESLYGTSDLLSTLNSARESLSSSSWCSIVFYSDSSLPFHTVSMGCRKATPRNLATSRELCKNLSCGCGLVERDGYSGCSGFVMVVLTKDSTLVFRDSPLDVRYRHYPKVSNR